MKINDLELYLVTVGQTDSATPSHSLLVRITTALGVEGWGESGLGWRVGELAARREALLAVLAGRSIYDIEELHTMKRSRRRRCGPRWKWPCGTCSAGRCDSRCAISSADTIGGGSPCRFGWRTPSGLAAVSRELAEQTHTQLIAAGRRGDIKTLAAIREMVGDRIALRSTA